MDQIPHCWDLVFCGWEAGRGGIALEGNKEYPKMEQSSSAALGFFWKSASSRAVPSSTGWHGQSDSFQDRLSAPRGPGPPLHHILRGIAKGRHLLARLSFMVLQEHGQAACVLTNNLLLPGLPWPSGGKNTVWKNLPLLKWGCWQAWALQCWEQQQEVWLHVKTSRFETVFTPRDYTNNIPGTMELFTQLTVWRKHLLLSTCGG